MYYKVISTSQFIEDLKYYEKTKGFRHIRKDIAKILEKLEIGDFVGDVIPDLKLDTIDHTYKVRIANTDTQAGKSNGYRLIYYLVKDDMEVYLITVYYKKDDNRIPTNQRIAELVKAYCL